MKYYELSGQLRQSVLDVLSDRKKAVTNIDKFTKSLGCAGWYHGGMFASSVTGFKPGNGVIPPGLRKRYNKQTRSHEDDILVPNLSNKDGKALQKQMRDLHLPGSYEIGKLLKMPAFGPGLSMWGAGVETFGLRVIASVPDMFEPKVKSCKRVSDMVVERLRAADKAARKKPKRVRK